MGTFKDFFNTLVNDFDEFCDEYLIRILICLGVLAVFLALKFVISAITKRIVRKAAKKSAGDEEKLKSIYGIFLPPLRVLTITAALAICASVLSLEGQAKVVSNNILTSLVIFAAFRGLFGFCNYLKMLIVGVTSKKGGMPHNLAGDYISAIAKIVVVIIGILTIMQQWEINVTSMLAGLSIGGVALALAAQDTAANIFGALTVIFERPFELGDFVELGGISGTVEKMGMRSTQIRQLNQSLVYVPNSKLASDNIINWRMISNRKVETTLGVTYSTPPEKLEEFITGIKKILADNEKIVADSGLVALTDFAASSLNIEMRYLINTSKFDEMNYVREQVNLAVLRFASSLGVSFAFPSTSVYMEKQ